MRCIIALAALAAAACPAAAQEVTQIDGRAALVFEAVGRPPRAALGYRDGVFVTPAALARLGAEPNSVVELRHPGRSVEARIFPIVQEGRRDATLYMARRMREALGVDAGSYRIELVALGARGASLEAAETALPACGEPGTWVFQRVGLPPRETLSLGDAVFVRADVLESMGLTAGIPVTVTIGRGSITVPIHPLADPERMETSIYIRGSLRERLGIEEGIHQVAVRWTPSASGIAAAVSAEASAEASQGDGAL